MSDYYFKEEIKKNMDIIISIVIGAVCGWLGSKIMKSKGGLLRNIIIGIVGGALGGWLLGFVPVLGNLGLVSTLLGGILGSCILIWIGRLIFK